MRRIPEQCGPESISLIAGTSRPKEQLEAAWKSRLKAGGFFVAADFGRFFAATRVNWRAAASVVL